MKPPEVPTPGMAGGEKRERDAFRKAGKFAVHALLDGLILLLGLLRSSQCFSVTKKKAL